MTGGRRSYVSCVLVFVSLIAVTACGKAAMVSPTAPTPAPAAGAPLSGTASIRGSVSTPVPSMKVAVTGTSLQAAVDAAGAFSLVGAPSGNIELQFQAPGVDARLPLANVADREQIDVHVVLNGNTAQLDADERVKQDDEAEVKGPIAAVDVASRTLRVGSASVQVPAQASILMGAASVRFEDLRVQERIDAEGVAQAGVIVASRIQVEDDGSAPQPPPAPQPPTPAPQPSPGDTQVEFTASLGGVSGACPAVTFLAAGRTVRTSSATAYQNGSCATLGNGVVIEVKGTSQSDGGVLATSIQFEDAPEPPQPVEVELTGLVSGLSGSCPAVRFSAGGAAVQATASTTFSNGGCSDLRNGATVEVKGTSANGLTTASQIKFDK